MAQTRWQRSVCLAVMRWLAISAPLILAALAGCDLTGQYDKKFHEALGAAAKRAVFDLVHPTFTDALDPAKAGVGVKLRLPIVFDSNSKTGAKLTGPFAAMAPGPMYVLQRDLDDNQGKWAPCIVAVMAVPKGDQKGDITKSLPAAPGATWTDVSVPTPAGQTATLKRMRIDMSQLAAQLPDAAKAALAKTGGGGLDNLMDMYVIDAGNSAVIVNWMVPKGQAQKYNLEKAIEASMGTLEVTVPPDAGGKGGKGPAAGKAPPTGCM